MVPTPSTRTATMPMRIGKPRRRRGLRGGGQSMVSADIRSLPALYRESFDMKVEIMVHAQTRRAGRVHFRGVDRSDLGAVHEETHLVPRDFDRERIAHLAAAIRFLDRGAISPVHDGRRVGARTTLDDLFPVLPHDEVRVLLAC